MLLRMCLSSAAPMCLSSDPLYALVVGSFVCAVCVLRPKKCVCVCERKREISIDNKKNMGNYLNNWH